MNKFLVHRSPASNCFENEYRTQQTSSGQRAKKRRGSLWPHAAQSKIAASGQLFLPPFGLNGEEAGADFSTGDLECAVLIDAGVAELMPKCR